MERTIFIRFMQCLGSWGGIVFEIIMAKVGLSSPIYSKMYTVIKSHVYKFILQQLTHVKTRHVHLDMQDMCNKLPN